MKEIDKIGHSVKDPSVKCPKAYSHLSTYLLGLFSFGFNNRNVRGIILLDLDGGGPTAHGTQISRVTAILFIGFERELQRGPSAVILGESISHLMLSW